MRSTPPILSAEFDVLGDGLPGEQRVLLEHDAAVGTGRRHPLAVDAGALPRADWREAGDRADDRGLSAPRRPEHAQEFAATDLEIDLAQGLDRGLALTEMDLDTAQRDAAGLRPSTERVHVGIRTSGSNHGMNRRPTQRTAKLLPMPRMPMLIMPSTMFGYFWSV